jgi:uncharacterized membrane protein
MDKGKVLLTVGFINFVHGLIHLLQFAQSIFLATYAVKSVKETSIHKALESPYMGIFWGLIGLLTMYIGYRDYKHHKHHKD